MVVRLLLGFVLVLVLVWLVDVAKERDWFRNTFLGKIIVSRTGTVRSAAVVFVGVVTVAASWPEIEKRWLGSDDRPTVRHRDVNGSILSPSAVCAIAVEYPECQSVASTSSGCEYLTSVLGDRTAHPKFVEHLHDACIAFVEGEASYR